MSHKFNPNLKVFDLKVHEERIDRLIPRLFSVYLMSNTKWEKLFSALDVDDMKLDQVLLKRVDREKPINSYMPKSEDLEGVWVAEGANVPLRR